ncbi:hypothetical protein SAMN05216327_105331, partial [Dyadobacter sp. SG02]|uniref:hypothetical protein n=1 Tax=Dyadobacter sp. SG02 TaxID=1855291 RepID=UPI0008B8B736
MMETHPAMLNATGPLKKPYNVCRFLRCAAPQNRPEISFSTIILVLCTLHNRMVQSTGIIVAMVDSKQSR